MTIGRACLLLAALFSLGACGTTRGPDYPTLLDNAAYGDAEAKETANKTIDALVSEYRKLKGPKTAGTATVGKDGAGKPSTPSSAKDAARRSDHLTSLRNQIVRRVLAILSLDFAKYEDRVFKNRAFGAVGFDLIDLGLDAAVAVAGGESTKALLGAIATAVHGAESSIDSNFYREKTSEALFSIMRADRYKIEERIEKALGLKDADYPLDAALVDLVEYYRAGTLPSALISLAKAAAEKEKEERKKADDTKSFKADSAYLKKRLEYTKQKDGLVKGVKGRFAALSLANQKKVLNLFEPGSGDRVASKSEASAALDELLFDGEIDLPKLLETISGAE